MSENKSVSFSFYDLQSYGNILYERHFQSSFYSTAGETWAYQQRKAA